jgi:hypothetical protein
MDNEPQGTATAEALTYLDQSWTLVFSPAWIRVPDRLFWAQAKTMPGKMTQKGYLDEASFPALTLVDETRFYATPKPFFDLPQMAQPSINKMNVNLRFTK